MNTLGQALAYTFAMGAVIFFCRAFPFLFFRGGEQGAADAGAGKETKAQALLNFVEKIAPPAAMTVLAVNSLAGNLGDNLSRNLPALIAAAAVVLLHLWKRNSLISIFGGTALYMILERIIIQN
jgi:branched-subunit amino acid transport protein AzlD